MYLEFKSVTGVWRFFTDVVPFFREGCRFSYVTFIESHTYSEKSSLTSGALLI